MRAIHKYQIEVMSTTVVNLPFIAKVLRADFQNDFLYLWVELDMTHPVVPRQFFVIGTGAVLPEDKKLTFINTVFVSDEVFHVYEILPPVPCAVPLTPHIALHAIPPAFENVFKHAVDAVQAFRVTTGNLEGLAAWCKGAIKGTMLPRGQQCIEFISFDREIRADVGDWIVKESPTNFNAYPHEIFEKVFKSC